MLIATNVIEEGLDVSECNLVICLNELLNVKAFIQMKGRARKRDSKFIFLCADVDNEVEMERENFDRVIQKMKELAFTKDSDVATIQPDLTRLKQNAVDVNEFYEVRDSGARISLRDSKSLIDVFCEAAAESGPS